MPPGHTLGHITARTEELDRWFHLGSALRSPAGLRLSSRYLKEALEGTFSRNDSEELRRTYGHLSGTYLKSGRVLALCADEIVSASRGGDSPVFDYDLGWCCKKGFLEDFRVSGVRLVQPSMRIVKPLGRFPPDLYL